LNKIQHILIGLCCLFSFSGNGQVSDKATNQFEQLVLEEVNFMRSNPQGYAENRLKTEFAEGEDNGAYDYLNKLKPVNKLVLNDKLNRLANNYARVIASKKALSHDYNGNPMKRANKAGYFGMIGENLAAGSEEKYNALINPQTAAIEFVKMLVIDRGVKDLGHRKILTEPRFKEMGVGFYRDPKDKLKNYFVQEFGRQQ
jgi:uncharacterized protein YkwD